MLKKLLLQALRVLIIRAVKSAEDNFGTGRGIQKKQFAVNYVLARIPMPIRIREIFATFLVELIGEGVELVHKEFACELSS